MKKTIVLICVVLLLSVACGAMAQTVWAQPAELLRPVLAGKTLTGIMSGYSLNGDGGISTMYVTLYEQARFAAKDVEALQPGDTLMGGGMSITVKAIEADEWGYTLTGEWDEILNLIRDDQGGYYAVDDTEHTLWLQVCQLECNMAEGFEFVDDSDPDPDAQPIVRPVEDLVKGYEGDMVFLPDNMRITFDDDCRVTQVLYLYTPWN